MTRIRCNAPIVAVCSLLALGAAWAPAWAQAPELPEVPDYSRWTPTASRARSVSAARWALSATPTCNSGHLHDEARALVRRGHAPVR